MAAEPSNFTAPKPSLADLPLDVLALVFPYLDARSFLALSATCKAFYQNIRLDATYWRHTARTTFRVPNRPTVEHDGARWQRLYKRMLTQSRVFTWGSNSHGCLGYFPEDGLGLETARRRIRAFMGSKWPVEVTNFRDVGIIADLQCGGWSTTILNSAGTLFMVGGMDGMTPVRQPPLELVSPTVLAFPPGYPRAGERDEPATAIRQFSSGRSHILALSDSGRIWSWYDRNDPALQVKTLHVDLVENSTSKPSRSNVRKVVAGWTKSSAYINGTGILLWDPVQRGRDQSAQELDTMLVMESAVVPGTSYQRPKGLSREPDDETRILGEQVGEVTNYILLQHFVVFVTDLGKVFAARMDWNGESGIVHSSIELPSLHSTSSTDPTPSATDVQGAFRSFAVFKRSGAVLIADHDYLDAVCSPQPPPATTLEQQIKIYPALQNTGVTTLAFGDYHFHALHSGGHITSYGTEPQSCGALGLGGDGDPEGRLRGIRYVGRSRDGALIPQAYASSGRRVWFQPEKKQWIRFMASGGRDPDEAKERLRMTVNDPAVQAEVSEWVEQEGRDWDRRGGMRGETDGGEEEDDGLGAHFVLNVAAAGWHSGALVLVNEELAARVREACIVPDPTTTAEAEEDAASAQPQGPLASAWSWLYNSARWFLGLPVPADEAATAAAPPQEQPLPFTDPQMHGASPGKGYRYVWADDAFPRLRLSDGREMPGEVEFSEWRFGRPQWSLDGA